MDELRDAGISTRGTGAGWRMPMLFVLLALDRRQALWKYRPKKDPKPFCRSADEDSYHPPVFGAGDDHPEHIVEIIPHLAFTQGTRCASVRPQLEQLRITTAAELKQMKNGDPVKVAGLVLVRQRPGTASGNLFHDH